MPVEQIKLDLKDRKILYQLDLNCRQSLGQIAKKVGLSKQVVSYRIKRLEEQKIIREYVTVMDTTKLGFYTFRMYFKLAHPSVKAYEMIINDLKNRKNVAWVIDAYGEWDLCCVFLTRSIEEFHLDIREFLAKYRDNIRAKDFAIMCETSYFRRAYILGQTQDTSKYDTITSPQGQVVAFDGDKTDWEILRALSGNGRAELQWVAEKVGLSPKAVSYRMKALQKKGIIQNFRAAFDVSLLGYDYYKVFLNLGLISREKEKELFTWLHMHPNVVFCTKPVGQADYEFEFQARGREEFWTVLTGLRERFSDCITAMSSLQFAREYKFLYLPDVIPI